MITNEQIDDLWDEFLEEFSSFGSDLSDKEYQLSQRLIRTLVREAIDLEEESKNGREE
jgi:hypothetical protein